jgi:hypothetical protein
VAATRKTRAKAKPANPGRRLRAVQYAGDRLLDRLYAPLATRAGVAVRRHDRGPDAPLTEADRLAILAEIGRWLDELTPAATAAIVATQALSAAVVGDGPGDGPVARRGAPSATNAVANVSGDG